MQTEVTNALWRRFLDADGYGQQRYWTKKGWMWRSENDVTQPRCWDIADWNLDEQPVVCVVWHEAVAFANWLSVEMGREIRLPTEAEWEKAARGADGRQFPWGDEWDATRVNYCDRNCPQETKDETGDDGYALTAPVGSYPRGASPYGALDMAGNAAEWVADWYAADAYRASPAGNPTGPVSGDNPVVRGGSWFFGPVSARSADRGENSIGSFVFLGFRLVSAGF
jgi:formylglycine-generating enzyme required for sulfatase activity